MMTSIAEFTNLTIDQLLLCFAAAIVAGMVRGFSGFGLSAILMAFVVVILPPVELIPLCYLLETVAGFAMLNNGVKNADMKMVWVLALSSAVGVPIGLWATVSIPVETSKLVALLLIMGLTLLQLCKVKMDFLNTRAGLYITGFTAGIVTGLASVGGMVIALYIISRAGEVKTMRASLVMFLFIGTFTSAIYMLSYGIMNMISVKRALVFAPTIIAGIGLGSLLFRPSLAVFYKQFCLILLATISLIGLYKMI